MAFLVHSLILSFHPVLLPFWFFSLSSWFLKELFLQDHRVCLHDPTVTVSFSFVSCGQYAEIFAINSFLAMFASSLWMSVCNKCPCVTGRGGYVSHDYILTSLYELELFRWPQSVCPSIHPSGRPSAILPRVSGLHSLLSSPGNAASWQNTLHFSPSWHFKFKSCSGWLFFILLGKSMNTGLMPFI